MPPLQKCNTSLKCTNTGRAKRHVRIYTIHIILVVIQVHIHLCIEVDNIVEYKLYRAGEVQHECNVCQHGLCTSFLPAQARKPGKSFPQHFVFASVTLKTLSCASFHVKHSYNSCQSRNNNQTSTWATSGKDQRCMQQHASGGAVGGIFPYRRTDNGACGSVFRLESCFLACFTAASMIPKCAICYTPTTSKQVQNIASEQRCSKLVPKINCMSQNRFFW